MPHPVPTRAAAPPSRVPTTTMPHHLRQGSPCALPPAPARSTEPHPESARLRRLARSVPVPRHTWPGRRSQPFSSGHQLPFTENRWRHARVLATRVGTWYGSSRREAKMCTRHKGRRGPIKGPAVSIVVRSYLLWPPGASFHPGGFLVQGVDVPGFPVVHEGR